MRGGGGVDDQRLHIGHVRQQREDFKGVDEFERFFLAALDLEGEDGTAAVREVALIQPMVGMAGERGVVHLGHLRVTGEVIHDLQRVFDMALHAQGKRLQALQEDETAHRGKRRADVAEKGISQFLLNKFPHRPAD